MESPTTAHHCSPLVSSHPIISLSSLSPLPHLWPGDTQAQWAWLDPIRNKAPISLTFLAQPQELRAIAGPEPEVDPFTDQKHPVPPQCSHIGKLKSRKRKGLSQNHTTSIRESDALILSVLCFFCEVFWTPSTRAVKKLSPLAVPILLPMCLPDSLKQSLIPWQEYDPREEAVRINMLGLHAFASPSFSDCAFPNLMICSNLLVKATEATAAALAGKLLLNWACLPSAGSTGRMQLHLKCSVHSFNYFLH